MSPPTRDGRPDKVESAHQIAATAKQLDASSLHPRTAYGVPADHPRPQVPRRAALPIEIPASAAVLAEAASSASWSVDLTYARGARLDRYGKPGKVVPCLAVRLRRGDERAAATFWGGAFRTGWKWTADPPTIPLAVGYRALVALVSAVRDGA